MKHQETHLSSTWPDAPYNTQDVLLTEQQAATLMNVNPRTLQKWRVKGGGPLFVRISRRCIRYRPKDITDWTQNRVKSSTSEI